MFSGRELKERMRRLKVLEEDLCETFVRSSGPGGQNVNKTSTCVVLRHVPTGIQVKCQTERSQRLNRLQARWLLVERIEKSREASELRILREKERERRRSRRRPRALREEILEEKRYHSAKKSLRRKVGNWD